MMLGVREKVETWCWNLKGCESVSVAGFVADLKLEG